MSGIPFPRFHAGEGSRFRIAAIDGLRGAALAGMIVYHAAWDLHAFGFLRPDPSVVWGWQILGHGVASIFLGLSGFGLSLAARRGARLAMMIQRLSIIATAAALVTLATGLLAPDAMIWFGILHCIVVTNLIALALRPLPNSVLITVAIASLVAPLWGQTDLGGGWWSWMGLSPTPPSTLDFRPVLPWLAPVLIGLVAGRSSLVERLALWPMTARAGRWTAAAGRHSLLVYLAHQPVLFALLMAITTSGGLGSEPSAILAKPKEAAAFLKECNAGCTKAGRDEISCQSTCHCVLTATIAGQGQIQATGFFRLWRRPPSALDQPLRTCVAAEGRD